MSDVMLVTRGGEPIVDIIADIRDELAETRRALVSLASGKVSRIIKFRMSPETRVRSNELGDPSRRSVILVRWADRVESERWKTIHGEQRMWSLPDGSLLGAASAMQWEEVVVADDAIGPLPIIPGHSFDLVNEFSARVTILNPMDPDTWDWREVKWLGVAEKDVTP